jgi:hypothetical protein
MYVNNIEGVGQNGAVQSAWPDQATISGGQGGQTVFLNQETPPKSDWGEVSLGARNQCKGVKLAMMKVGTATPNVSEDEISLGNVGSVTCPTSSSSLVTDAENTFFARPENTGPNTAGQVSVEFRLADWGVSAGTFNQIPSSGNPVSAKDIQGNQSERYEMEWHLSEQEVCKYRNNQHQCILVQMQSESPNTQFLNKGVTRNMDFVSASTFQREATIDLRGLRPPEGRDFHRVFLDIQSQVQRFLETEEGYQALLPDDVMEVRREYFEEEQVLEDVPPVVSSLQGIETVDRRYYEDGLVEALTWVTNAYAAQPGSLRIRGNDYQTVEYVGGFGVVAGHSKDNVTSWAQNFEAPGLEPLSEDDDDGDRIELGDERTGEIEGRMYTLRVPKEEPVSASVRIQVREEDGDGGDEVDTGDDDSILDEICNLGGGSSTSNFLLLIGLSLIGIIAYHRRRRG